MHTPKDSHPRVLVVDDDRAIQVMFDVVLKHHGFHADVVADGQAALERLRDHEYDAILLDLMLPRTNGFEVIGHLKAGESQLLTRTIVVTAASGRTLELLDADDVHAVLKKPFDLDELIAALLSCMGDRNDEHRLPAALAAHGARSGV